MTKRILFLYLTKHSGHYSAAVSIDQALRRLDGHVESMLLDSFSHANPILSKMTLKAYLAALKAAPEIWEWMYDNPDFKERTKRIRELLNRGNSKKLQKLLHEFRPDVVVCTQGFACGVIASWKRATHRRTPLLVGVLTDFVAHRYWADDQVDLYIAPNEHTQQTLITQGVLPERVAVNGIPISERYCRVTDRAATLKALGLKPDLPKIVVMGGSLGLGLVGNFLRGGAGGLRRRVLRPAVSFGPERCRTCNAEQHERAVRDLDQVARERHNVDSGGRHDQRP